MNEQIESCFVNTYIQKQYRERLLFELKDISSKNKRRNNAFTKFSHSAEKYVIPDMVAVSSNKSTEQDVLDFVKNMVSENTCYYMDDCGGDEMPLRTAVEKAFNYSGACIIVYNEKFSIVKEEAEMGAAKKIILINR